MDWRKQRTKKWLLEVGMQRRPQKSSADTGFRPTFWNLCHLWPQEELSMCGLSLPDATADQGKEGNKCWNGDRVTHPTESSSKRGGSFICVYFGGQSSYLSVTDF